MARAASTVRQVPERGEDVVGQLAHEVVDALQALGVGAAVARQLTSPGHDVRMVGVDVFRRLEVLPEVLGHGSPPLPAADIAS